MPVTPLLKPEISALFEKALAAELHASNLYKHIANQLQRLGFFGAQSYYLKESAEELTHYGIIAEHLNNMGSVACVPEVPRMADVIMSISDALEVSYETEVALMNQYNEFYEFAEENEDHITEVFLNQFILIQVKSVGVYADLISRLSLGGDIFVFDKEMSKLA